MNDNEVMVRLNSNATDGIEVDYHSVFKTSYFFIFENVLIMGLECYFIWLEIFFMFLDSA